MDFFIDTANLDQIREAQELGILDGVTTNPSLMAKEGIYGTDNVHDHYRKICSLVTGPVSAEVISTGKEEMVTEGIALFNLNPAQIVVKIPMTENGLAAIKKLKEIKIPTNCTLIFSVSQALLAAKAGATYVSPFVGRLDDISSDGIQLINQIRQVFDNYQLDALILAASIRNTRHIIDCAEIGSDVVTAPLKVFKMLIKHPLTDAGLQKFLDDYNALKP